MTKRLLEQKGFFVLHYSIAVHYLRKSEKELKKGRILEARTDVAVLLTECIPTFL